MRPTPPPLPPTFWHLPTPLFLNYLKLTWHSYSTLWEQNTDPCICAPHPPLPPTVSELLKANLTLVFHSLGTEDRPLYLCASPFPPPPPPHFLAPSYASVSELLKANLTLVFHSLGTEDRPLYLCASPFRPTPHPPPPPTFWHLPTPVFLNYLKLT